MIFQYTLLIFLFILAFPAITYAHQKIVTHEVKIEVEKNKAQVLLYFKIELEQAAMAMTSMFPHIVATQPNDTFEKEQIARFLFQQEKILCFLHENSKDLLNDVNYKIKSKWPKENTGIIEIMALAEFAISPSSTKFAWSFLHHSKQIVKFESILSAHYTIDTVEVKPSSEKEHVHKTTLADQKTLINFAAERNISLILTFHKKGNL
mgnify:CR=1 FL=1